MYDLHNHLLPGIDDGAKDLHTAIELAQLAVDDGITHMVCTPHIHPGRYENTPQTISQALSKFATRLKELDIPLNVAAGAEIRIGPEILQKIPQNELPFIGKWQDQPVLLLEFPSNSIPLGSEKLTQWLLKQNIIPMIAHPERNQVFQEFASRLDSFILQGCLTQVTASALLGNFGKNAMHCARKLLSEDKITILASDAHNIKYRPPILSDSFEYVANEISIDKAEQLFALNPAEIAKSKFNTVVSPL